MSGDAKAIAVIAKSYAQVLGVLGEDVSRDGLKDTPARVASMLLEMTSGLRAPPPEVTFFEGSADQMITVLDIDYNSLCEHHLVTFYGRVHIGYIPSTKIAGLSKFARIVDWFASRPQIQERLTGQIADFIVEKLSPLGVIVVVEGRHLCMSIRGVHKQNHSTVTSAIRGNIPKDEFFDILNMRRI
jgi:GTP cyclohydrolase I